MNYEVTIKLSLASRDSAEQIAKRLRAVLEFGTTREVIGDALDLPTDYHLIDVTIISQSGVDVR